MNDAPVLTTIDDQAIDEDGVLSLTLSGSDVDADDLTYSASVDGNAAIDVTGTQLTVTPDSDYNGSITVSVNVTDGEYVDSQDFALTVNACLLYTSPSPRDS